MKKKKLSENLGNRTWNTYFTIEAAIRRNAHFFLRFFSSSTLLFELIGQCLMFTAFDCALQMNASAYDRTRIRTLLNFCTHTLKTFPHSSVSGGGVDDVCIRNCVGFSRAAIFFSLFSCSFSIFCSAIFGRSTETDKREMSVSISINTAWKMNVSTLRTAKKNWCEYVRVWRRHACVCVDFSFTIVNKSTIWHRLSFNLIWRFWLFIFSSCVNSTPVQIYVRTDT